MSKAPHYIINKIKVKESLPAAWNMLDVEGQRRVILWADKWNVSIAEFIKGV